MNDSTKTKLIDRQEITDSTLEFHLERPSGFQYQAGQHINIKLSNLLFEDKKGPRRTFTLSSAPHEKALHVTTRLTGSGFKRTVLEGPLQEVEFIGPRGELVLDEASPAVFIAGGIGITPFRSMVLDVLQRGVSQSMTLLYSNRHPNAAAYHDMFEILQQEHPQQFTYVPTMPELKEQKTEWQGETRLITGDFIRDYVTDLSRAIFYLCGPPNMVKSIQDLLESEGIDPPRIKSESFWGY